MELQLGLVLPSNSTKNLNLNKYDNDPKDEAWTWSHSCYSVRNKAHYDDTFEIVSPLAQTLPLLSCIDKPNDEDDGDADRNNLKKSSYSCTIHESNGEGDGIMGWSPIQRSRMKLQLHLHLNLHLHQHHHHQQQLLQQNQAGHQFQNDGRNEEMDSRRPNSIYVKVKMEGVSIGRKLDLSLHRSYQTLNNTLITMFGKYMRGSYVDTRFTLAYQDRDAGYWLLVRDIPWRTFVRSVQRLKILRIGV